MIFAFFAFFPLAILLSRLHGFDSHFFASIYTSGEFLSALKFTLIQAFVSSVVSTTLVLIAIPGYAVLKRGKFLARTLLIFPQIVSTIFVVLGLLITFAQFSAGFPFGFWGVIVGHVAVNAGFCLLILGEKASQIELQWAGLAEFLDASRLFYFRKIMLPLLLPVFASTFALVFVFCLGSLVIPLSLGGGPQASTLEVLIYEKLKSAGDISGAVGVAFAQALLQFGVFLAVYRKLPFVRQEKAKASQMASDLFACSKKLNFRFSLLALWTVISILFLPYLKIIQMALENFPTFPAMLENGLNNSLLLSLLVALAVGMTVMVLTLLWNMRGSSTLLLKLPTWSSVILGLAGFILFSTSTFNNSISLFLALTIFETLGIYLIVQRVIAYPLMEMQRRYYPVMTIWKGDFFFMMRKVFFPLNAKVYLLGGLLAFSWSIGEFSIASILSPAGATLPLFVQSLLSQYRLEGAAVCSLFLLAFGIIGSLASEALLHGEN